MKVTVPKLSFIALSLVMASSINAANFGSPDTVDNTIAENAREKRTWRESLAEDHNLTFGLDYQALGLTASDPQSGGEDTASAGVARFMVVGIWLVLSLEIRADWFGKSNTAMLIVICHQKSLASSAMG